MSTDGSDTVFREAFLRGTAAYRAKDSKFIAWDMGDPDGDASAVATVRWELGKLEVVDLWTELPEPRWSPPTKREGRKCSRKTWKRGRGSCSPTRQQRKLRKRLARHMDAKIIREMENAFAPTTYQGGGRNQGKTLTMDLIRQMGITARSTP